jgi:hypothetical protein
MCEAPWPVAEAVGDPDVALAVDGKSTGARTDTEFLRLARIGRWKPRNVPGESVGHPYSVLLVDTEVEWPQERFARLRVVALANDLALGQIALRKIDKLALRRAEYPHVAAGGDYYTLHQPELTIESNAVRWR